MINKNKRGIMVKFLVTILITIIVFAPAIAFVSKLFYQEEQANKSFDNFADKFKTFASGTETKGGPEVLIMDQDTSILGFEKDTKVYYKYISYKLKLITGGGTSGKVEETYPLYKVTSDYPKTECEGESCICLCKDIKRTATEKENPYTLKLTCGKITCKKIAGLDFISGIKNDAKIGSFNIKEGFVYERRKSQYLAGFGTTYRRSSLYFEKTSDGKLMICDEPSCIKFMTNIIN